MTPVQKIVLTAMGVIVAPLLELTALKWSFEAQRTALKRSLQRLGARTAVAVSERELSAWRELIINQRMSLRKLRMHLLEKTQVWTGATYQPVDQLANADLLHALLTHTKEALELLDVFERVHPDILERTVYSKMRVTLRCYCCFQFGPFSALKTPETST